MSSTANGVSTSTASAGPDSPRWTPSASVAHTHAPPAATTSAPPSPTPTAARPWTAASRRSVTRDRPGQPSLDAERERGPHARPARRDDERATQPDPDGGPTVDRGEPAVGDTRSARTALAGRRARAWPTRTPRPPRRRARHPARPRRRPDRGPRRAGGR